MTSFRPDSNNMQGMSMVTQRAKQVQNELYTNQQSLVVLFYFLAGPRNRSEGFGGE